MKRWRNDGRERRGRAGALLTISGPWCGVYNVQWGFPEGICTRFWRNL